MSAAPLKVTRLPSWSLRLSLFCSLRPIYFTIKLLLRFMIPFCFWSFSCSNPALGPWDQHSGCLIGAHLVESLSFLGLCPLSWASPTSTCYPLLETSNHYWAWDMPLRHGQAWEAGSVFCFSDPLGPSQVGPSQAPCPTSTRRVLVATSR